MAEAHLADVDRRYPCIGLAQRMDRRPARYRSRRPGSPGRSAAFSARPQQQRSRPAPVRVAVKFAVPVEIAERRRIGVTLVKTAHRVGHPLAPLPRLHGRVPRAHCGEPVAKSWIVQISGVALTLISPPYGMLKSTIITIAPLSITNSNRPSTKWRRPESPI